MHYPSFGPALKYLENRTLRKKLYKAFSSKAFKGDKFDNQENIKKIVNLRLKSAKLLGYKTYADFVLEERMANSIEIVNNFF